jgi:hypothetical protein
MFKAEEQAKQETRVKQAEASRTNPVWIGQDSGPEKGSSTTCRACCQLNAFLLGVLFDLENGAGIFLRNVG